MPCAIIIYGPTAVGKTDFAQSLAEHIGGEIINADAAQFYTPLTIGTAKPDWRHASVPHHLFDICNEPANYSSARFRVDAETLVESITNCDKIPIFVGGSGFYIHSLYFPVRENIGQLSSDQQVQVIEPSWEKLNALDPVRATAIHPHDTYRIGRALLLYQQTKQLPSSLEPAYCPITQFFLVELSCAAEVLKDRIQCRVSTMLDAGWIAEAETLIGTPWEEFVLQKKWIGYPELIAYIHAGKPVEQLPALQAAIARNTWRYARRQMTYGRMLAHKIKVHNKESYMKIDLTSQPLELYLKQLTNFLTKRCV